MKPVALKSLLLFVAFMSGLMSLHAGDKQGIKTEAGFSAHKLLLLGDTLPAPELKCISFQDTGEISVQWLEVADLTSSFYCYVIYRSSSATTAFQAIDTIWDRTNTSLSDVSSLAVPGNFYSVSTVSQILPQQFVEVHGDTMRSMLLTVINPGVNTGIAQLGWNSPYYSKPAPGQMYYIWQKPPSDNWKLIDSVNSLSYEDSINICNGDLLYQVEVRDSLCISRSNYDGGSFQDKLPPPVPEIDSVSVDQGDVVIKWSESTARDVYGYIIFKRINNLWTPLDTLYGISNTYYSDSLADGCNAVNKYNVLAFDSCWNTSPSGKDHQNLVLNANRNICENKVTLSWNEYINMKDTLSGYHILRSTNNGPFQQVAFNSSGNLTLTDSNLVDSTHYCYFIRAVNSSGTRSSSTCRQCFLHVKPSAPGFIYLSSASVDHGSGDINIRGIIDTVNSSAGINLYRSEQPGTGFQLLSKIPYTGSQVFSFQDANVNSGNTVYYYQAYATDTCENEVVGSNVVNNILLTGEDADFMLNRLEWNEFDGWLGTPSLYSIYRREQSSAKYSLLLAQDLYNGGVYQDNVSALSGSTGNFYYYIKAVENTGNPYGIRDSSLSNLIMIQQESKVYIPSAFTPGGYNPVFKPYNVYLEAQDYDFRIYNRWGQLIFTASNPTRGWNGNYKGDPAPAGTYIYILKFKTKDGASHSKKGTVILLR